MTFHYFDLYGDNVEGCDDYISVTYGGTTQQLCNHQFTFPGPIPDPITTSDTTMTIKLVTSASTSPTGQTGFLASVNTGVNVTTDVIGECALYCYWLLRSTLVIMLGSWPACLHISGPEGYFKTEDCRAQKFYVCQNDADFFPPPQGADFISKSSYV